MIVNRCKDLARCTVTQSIVTADSRLLGYTLPADIHFVKAWIEREETTLKRVSEVVADNLTYNSKDSWLIACGEIGGVQWPTKAELRTRTLHGKDVQDLREGSTKHHKLMFPRDWEDWTAEETPFIGG